MTGDGLVHLGRAWYGLPNFLHIRCMQFSYLTYTDYECVPNMPATCLECLGREFNTNDAPIRRRI